MRNRPKVAITYPDIADDLESWANARDVAGDPYIVGINEAMRTGENLSYWADRDPMEWLPRPRSEASTKLSRRARFISITRNVLIFAPVALTWFAIGEATRAFDQYIDSGAESTANFLEFWQDGKGLLDEKWRIGNVATLDFQIIMVLIVLSFFAGILQARALKISQRDSAVFEDERIALALRIGEALNPHQAISDATMSKTLVLVLDRLEKVARSLESAGKEMTQGAKVLTPKMKSSIGEMDRSAVRVKRAAAEVQRTSVAINKVASKLRSPSRLRSKK